MHSLDRSPDICIAGAGIIGLSLALELNSRGLRVTVLDRSEPMTEASVAAAGMLAAQDPNNSPLLQSLSDLSLSLYPPFLDQLAFLSRIRVSFHTHTTLQALEATQTSSANILTPQDLAHLLPSLLPGAHRFFLLDESSLDPRQLAAALLAAVRATTIDLRANTTVVSTESSKESITVHTSSGILHGAQFVDCTGAWAASAGVTPKKGQMLAVSLPRTLPLNFVIRTPDVYIVPRTDDPRFPRAVIGATVEDAEFDKTVHAADIAHLRLLAAELLPCLAQSPELETWAGLRPATSDRLPLLGALPGRVHHYLATGHYRNGILLAPATARVMAQHLMGETTSIDLNPYSPSRLISEPPHPQMTR